MKNSKNNNIIIDEYLRKLGEMENALKQKSDYNILILQNRYLQLLFDISNSIIRDDFDCFLAKVVDAAITIANAERGFLMLSIEEKKFEFKVARNKNRQNIRFEETRVSRGVVNKTAVTRKSIFITNVHQNEDFQSRKSIVELKSGMIMCLPLIIKEKLIGLLYIDSQLTSDSFTDIERTFLEMFASEASVAIENMHLYQASIHDNLTGLYNYGYLRYRLGQEMMRISRYHKDGFLSFMMIDVDKFKTINDTYGHAKGDMVLRNLAGILKNNIREVDIVARYGGDEFAVLMPETDKECAKIVAQRLLVQTRDHLSISVGGGIIPVTISIGLVILFPERHQDIESVIIKADNVLYLSKHKGGNTLNYFVCGKTEEPEEVEIIANSAPMTKIMADVEKIAAVDANLLIYGETGTGKEIIARLIHRLSPRKDKPFVVLNCVAIPETLFESELFGYKKGAFTGAYHDQKGKFEQAYGGTLMLDEIGELPYSVQAKLLRAIETKEIEKIGSRKPIKMDIRIIATTNRDLAEEIKIGNFREDLFYRLNVITIHMPPLRGRLDDIEPLAEYYLGLANRKYNKKIKGFTKGAIEMMRQHIWPGNIRELINWIEKAVINSDKDYITCKAPGLSNMKSSPRSLKVFRGEIEKERILEALKINRWNKSKTALDLGISRPTLRALIKRYKITSD